MFQEKLESYLKSIDDQIDLFDFNTIERSFKYALRFELGDKLKNGTKERVNQATQRASEIFKECFLEDNDLLILSYEWKDEMFARTPEYLEQIIDSNNSVFNGLLAAGYSDNERPDYLEGKIQVFETSFSHLNSEAIFQGIANTEMGFEPCIHQIVFIFGQSSQKVFWMYDDRGCLVMSNEPRQMSNDFQKHKKWLCEGYRTHFLKAIQNTD